MTVTVSPKFQVVIPKEVREILSLKIGSKVTVLAKGGMAYLIPVKPVSQIKGLVKKLKPSGLRDKRDRGL